MVNRAWPPGGLRVSRLLWGILWLRVASAEAPPSATAFADAASTRLRLLSKAANQVLMAPAVAEEPRFASTLHKVSAQLQESAGILQKWGQDYTKTADANDMAMQLAEQGAEYEVRDLKLKLRKAIEADQAAQLDAPRRLAELTAKVSKLRSEVQRLRARSPKGLEAKPKAVATALISGAWPKPPSNATEARVGLFMRGVSQRVSAKQQDEEAQQNLDKLESHLASLEGQLEDAHNDVAAKHAASEAARQLLRDESQAAASAVQPMEEKEADDMLDG